MLCEEQQKPKCCVKNSKSQNFVWRPAKAKNRKVRLGQFLSVKTEWAPKEGWSEKKNAGAATQIFSLYLADTVLSQYCIPIHPAKL